MPCIFVLEKKKYGKELKEYYLSAANLNSLQVKCAVGIDLNDCIEE